MNGFSPVRSGHSRRVVWSWLICQWLVACCLGGVGVRGAWAQQPEVAQAPTSHPTTGVATGPATAPSGPQQPGDVLAVTEHQITVNGQVIKYRATAGRLQMKDESGKPKADFFFVAYEKEPGSVPAAQRPLTFVFNGGPGAAAVWLQLGAVGPKRLRLNEQGDPGSPPYALVDNDQTWLQMSDLVFIDPVGTGYSRAAAGEKAQDFYGVEQDISSVAEFIRLYLTRWQRWLSPKFLAGESYGTTRAAGLSQYLHDHDGIDLNGIIFISSVLNFQTIQITEGNDLPYAMYLPSYAAAAWYYKKLPPDLQQMELSKVLAEARQWATGEYPTLLALGSALSPAQRQSAVEHLARYTGLSADYIEKSNLRINPGGFEVTLLGQQRQLLGRFDCRIAGPNPDPLNKHPEYDPSLAMYIGAYTATINDYIRRDLDYSSDLPYEVLTGKVFPWNFGPSGNGYLYVGDNLRSAMLQNPWMKVMFASGYFDLATPFLSTDYTIDHLHLPANLRDNVVQHYYLGGHMLYHTHANLVQLKSDVAELMRSSLGRQP